jgi:hypothetical protein
MMPKNCAIAGNGADTAGEGLKNRFFTAGLKLSIATLIGNTIGRGAVSRLPSNRAVGFSEAAHGHGLE